MKKFILGFVMGAIIFTGVSVIAEQYFTATPNPFDVVLNGKKIDIEGYGIDGRTYFQLRDLGEKIGFDVDFVDSQIIIKTDVANSNGTTTPITSVKEEIKTIDETTISVNGELYYRPTIFKSSHNADVRINIDNRTWCIYLDETLIIEFGADSPFVKLIDGASYVSKEYCDTYIIPAIEKYKASTENK